jgi:hypothetical protein
MFLIQIFMTLEGKGGKSEDSDTSSDLGALCVQNFYVFVSY